MATALDVNVLLMDYPAISPHALVYRPAPATHRGPRRKWRPEDHESVLTLVGAALSTRPRTLVALCEEFDIQYVVWRPDQMSTRDGNHILDRFLIPVYRGRTVYVDCVDSKKLHDVILQAYVDFRRSLLTGSPEIASLWDELSELAPQGIPGGGASPFDILQAGHDCFGLDDASFRRLNDVDNPCVILFTRGPDVFTAGAVEGYGEVQVETTSPIVVRHGARSAPAGVKVAFPGPFVPGRRYLLQMQVHLERGQTTAQVLDDAGKQIAEMPWRVARDQPAIELGFVVQTATSALTVRILSYESGSVLTVPYLAIARGDRRFAEIRVGSTSFGTFHSASPLGDSGLTLFVSTP